MTTFGLIPFAIRPPLQLLLGLGLMVAPFALGLAPAGAIMAVLAGVLVVGVALGSTVTERGTSPLPLSAVYGFDWGIALGLLGSACALGLTGHRDATLLLAAFGAAQVLLTLTTRWTLRA
jgi:hypothetical protein